MANGGAENIEPVGDLGAGHSLTFSGL